MALPVGVVKQVDELIQICRWGEESVHWLPMLLCGCLSGEIFRAG